MGGVGGMKGVVTVDGVGSGKDGGHSGWCRKDGGQSGWCR